jgi:hypothetical protein
MHVFMIVKLRDWFNVSSVVIGGSNRYGRVSDDVSRMECFENMFRILRDSSEQSLLLSFCRAAVILANPCLLMGVLFPVNAVVSSSVRPRARIKHIISFSNPNHQAPSSFLQSSHHHHPTPWHHLR